MISKIKSYIENKINIRKVINNLEDFCYIYYDNKGDIVLHFNSINKNSITISDNKNILFNKFKNNYNFILLSEHKYFLTDKFINLLQIKEVKDNKVVLKEKYSTGENVEIHISKEEQIVLNQSLTKLKIKGF
jgi:hypothetical protein